MMRLKDNLLPLHLILRAYRSSLFISPAGSPISHRQLYKKNNFEAGSTERMMQRASVFGVGGVNGEFNTSRRELFKNLNKINPPRWNGIRAGGGRKVRQNFRFVTLITSAGSSLRLSSIFIQINNGREFSEIMLGVDIIKNEIPFLANTVPPLIIIL